LAESSVNNLSKSFEVSEKSATSAADTIAEQNKRNIIPMLPNNKSKSMDDKKGKLGSESNGFGIS
jgi:hypothetical protein